MMVNGVEPGERFIMQLVFSSSVMGAPPLCLLRYHMKAALYAFSLEQDPHAIVVTFSRIPFEICRDSFDLKIESSMASLKYLCVSFGCYSHQATVQLLGIALAREEAQGWPVDESPLIVWILQDFEHIRMIVAQWQR